MLALGIDASTQSCSAVVIDSEQGRIVAEAAVNFGERLPGYGAPQGFIPDGQDGEVHADPRMWLDALELLLSDLAVRCDLSRIGAISGAGQQHGSVYLNAQWSKAVTSLDPTETLAEQIAPCLSRPTAPIWMDHSTTRQCREIAAALGGDPEVCARSGSIAIERFTGPQIRRFHQLDPKNYRETARIHLVSSFLGSILSGSDAAIDHGDAAGMNLLNLQFWDWDPALLEATAPGLRERLPPPVPGTTVIGAIAPYFVKKFGFNPEAAVSVFTGDNPSSLVGMGAFAPGKVVISLGTSDTFFAALPAVQTDPNGFGHVFGNPAGGAMSLQCFINGSLAREAVKDRFGYDWEAFSNAFATTAPGAGGNLMFPSFRPEISPRLNRTEPLLAGSDAFCNGNTPDEAVRACVEGQFVNMKLRSHWMGLATDTVYLTGGASRNDAIAKVAADVFQAKVLRLAVPGSVALGGAMRAAANSGSTNLSALEEQFCQPQPGSAIDPDPATREVYNELAGKLDRALGQ